MLQHLSRMLRTAPAVLLRTDRAGQLPPHVQLDVTTECNLNCAMCYAKKAVGSGERHCSLTFVQFKKIFDDIRPVSINLAASGEPFMNPELFEMIAYARQRGAQTIISTNFVLPDEAMIRKIVRSGPDILKISIDGASKAVYESVRGRVFDRLLRNLELLAAETARCPSSPVSARFDFVMLKTNAADIAALTDLARRFGIRHIFYRICDPRGWDAARRNDLLTGSFDAVRSELEEAEKHAASYGILTNAGRLLSRSGDWRFIYENGGTAEPDGRKHPVCLLPWLQYFVSVRGDTSYCCSIYPSENLSCGNILKESAAEVWNGERFRKVRNVFRKKENYRIFEGCRYCMPMDAGYIKDLVRLFPRYLSRLFTGAGKE